MTTERHSPRRILVIERLDSGHRLMYVRIIANRAVRHGHFVAVLIPAGSSSSPHLVDLHPNVRVIELAADKASSLQRILARYTSDIDHIVLPDGDRAAVSFAWRRRPRATISLLVMREPNGYGGVIASLKTQIKRTMYRIANRRGGVAVFVLRSAGDDRSSELQLVFDPITWSATPTSIAIAKRSLLGEDDRYWFAIVGAITARKNVVLVADALSRLAMGHEIGLLIAGAQTEEVAADMRRVREVADDAGLRLVEIARPLQDSELDDLIGAVDCVVLAHSNEGPSGILGKSVLAGKPVLTAGAASLRNDVRQLYQVGGYWAPLDTSSVSRSAREVICAKRPVVAAADRIIGEEGLDPLWKVRPT